MFYLMRFIKVSTQGQLQNLSSTLIGSMHWVKSVAGVLLSTRNLTCRTTKEVSTKKSIHSIWKLLFQHILQLQLWKFNEKYNIHHAISLRELKITGNISVVIKWVSRTLFRENCQKPVDCCDSLLTRKFQASFLGKASYWFWEMDPLP